MYTCSICNAKKTQLSSNPEFEFRRRRQPNEEAFVEGVSDWCDQCGALRFFFRSDIDVDPVQHLDENAKNELASTILNAAARKQKLADVAQRMKQRELFREVHQTLRRDILDELPPQVPQNSMWRGQIRSVSEDRSQRRRKIPEESKPRSKSAINETRNRRSTMHGVQAERRGRTAERYTKKLGEKQVQLAGPTNAEAKEPHNLLDDEQHSCRYDDDVSHRNPLPVAKQQQQQQRKDSKNPWYEEMQQQVQQVVGNSPSHKRKYRCILSNQEDCNHQTENNLAKRHSAADLMAAGPKARLAKEDMNRELQELRDMEKMETLNIKLNEKLLQLSEWERISRRVEAESKRVRAELNDLQLEKELQVECLRNQEPDDPARQCGGAQIVPPPPSNSAHDIERGIEKAIGDALDQKLECMIMENAADEKQAQLEQLDDQAEPMENGPPSFGPTAPPAYDLEEAAAIDSECSVRCMRSSQYNNIKVSPTYFLRGKRVQSKLNMLVSTVQRACYRGFPEDPQQLMQNLHSSQLLIRREPPLAQFVTLPCSHSELAALMHAKQDMLEHQLRPLKVCRSPVYCPDGDCRRMFFISDFNEHLTHGHPSLAMERIMPHQVKTFFLDTRVTYPNKAKCHMVYFLRDKFIDHHSAKFPSLLPVMVMSARLDIVDIFASSTDSKSSCRPLSNGPENEVFLIWLTSIRPDDLKLMGTISVWPTNNRPMAEYIVVQTTELYNIRSSQKLKCICKSNRVLMLSGSQVHRMTEGGKYLLAVQVQIY